MANKRMFSLQIVDTDAFLEMPMTSQLLYFHLAMRADDEGFVGNPKRVIKMIGSSEDDFKVLIAKRFLLTFESGVVVIKHWLIHNTIRMDRFSPTKYEDEKGRLYLKENKAYTEVPTKGLPLGNQMATQDKISKVKLSKDKINTLSLKSGEKMGKEKAYYRNTGEEMRFTKKDKKWWVIPRDGGEWLEFAGSIKNDIEWKIVC
jgi:hypothetical protein